MMVLGPKHAGAFLMYYLSTYHFLGAFAKLQKATINLDMSVRLPA